ncbi:SDR family NAD(P)-dependent oxidoreductase, partial [Streptomyces diastaticus]|nr:SDR family NAD(P)-dependent oxidoreductase [Streptomyces diastaticus]
GPALRAQAARLGAHLREHPGPGLLDVAHAAATTRAALERRAVVLADDLEGLLDGLDALAAGRPVPGAGTQDVKDDGAVAFLFSGQGSQACGMGKDLYDTFPVFAETFDAVCARLEDALGTPLREVVFGTDEALLNGTAHAQPALFALGVAQFRLLQSWGLTPDFVAGHSVGELAAAHVAGVLSLDHACELVAARARLMGDLPAGGTMAALGVSEETAAALLAEHGGAIAVAAVNGPESVVVSGDEDAVLAVCATVTARGGTARHLRVSHAFHSARMEPMLDEFARVAATLDFRPPRIPVVSNVSGALAAAGDLDSPDYWVRHVRETVRFHDGVRTLAGEGVTHFVELGPDSALSALGTGCLPDDGTAVFTPLTRRGGTGVTGLVAAVARLHARGRAVDWTAFFAALSGTTDTRRVELPTHAFQHRRFWLDAAPAASADGAGAGQTAAAHPLLGAVISAPDTGGVTLTGRLSAQAQPWLGDHRVLGRTTLPGTAYVELVLRAGDQVGCPRIEELTLQSPLVVPDRGGVAVQVVVGPETNGHRPVSVHSRDEAAAEQDPWTRHALGTLTPAPETEPDGDLAQWPPAGAEPVPVTDAYDRLLRRGYGYGPAFQALRAAWRRGDEVFAEVALAAEAARDATAFGLHPALLDAAMHADLLGDLLGQGDGEDATLMPFVWNDVTLHTRGASALRVRIQRLDGGELSAMDVADPTGRPVATVGSLVSRPVAPDTFDDAGAGLPLYGVTWQPAPTGGAPVADHRWAVLGDGPQPPDADAAYPDLAALRAAVEAGRPVPETVLAYCAPAPGPGGRDADGDLPGLLRPVTEEALQLLQAWLADSRFAAARLVLATRGAVRLGTEPDAGPAGLAAAPVWGLVRAAAEENPGRFGLVDLDGTAPSTHALSAALASGEPEVALRTGTAYLPRLTELPDPGPGTGPRPDPEGTVLITGGTGGLGAILAGHLVRTRGVRHLLLVSRRGSAAPGAAGLVTELTGLGASVRVAACDVTDRDALAALLAGIPAEHPLTAVVHAAAGADSGLIGSMTPGRLASVLRPKAEAAWHLHELTADLGLADFVLFSSAGGMFLAAGQANYAAANTFLDALAGHRAALGLPATSMAFGLWSENTGLGGDLEDGDLRRMARLGTPALTRVEGLALYDRASRADAPVTVPARLDPQALGRRRGPLPALLRGLAPAPAPRP